MGEYHAWRGPATGMTLWRAGPDPGVQRILPDGVMDLMWHDERLVLAGPDTTAVVTASDTGSVAWGLRLAPGRLHALLGVAASELVGRRIELSDLAEVPPSLRAAAHLDPAAALERVFLTLWERADVPSDRALLRLADSLDRAARSNVNVRDVATRHDLSDRTLRRLSDRLFGYGPKTLASIHRFQRALGLARAGTPLSEAAIMAGYADQSHFNRETRRLAGTTPGALVG